MFILYNGSSHFSTDGETVLNALKQVFYDPPLDDPCDCEPHTELLELPYSQGNVPRRTSGASSVSGNDKNTSVNSYFALGDSFLLDKLLLLRKYS